MVSAVYFSLPVTFTFCTLKRWSVPTPAPPPQPPWSAASTAASAGAAPSAASAGSRPGVFLLARFAAPPGGGGSAGFCALPPRPQGPAGKFETAPGPSPDGFFSRLWGCASLRRRAHSVVWGGCSGVSGCGRRSPVGCRGRPGSPGAVRPRSPGCGAGPPQTAPSCAGLPVRPNP